MSRLFPMARCRLPIPERRAAPSAGARDQAAFTLIEILVTVALLSFIILGLFAMFNQVQRAFRSSMNQVDQLEAGRAVTEMLPRELEQITPSGGNVYTFCAQIIGSSAPLSAPLTQVLPGGMSVSRTNLLEDCFLLLRQNQTWVGIGYCVRTISPTGVLQLPETGPGQLGAGTLYRFATNLPVLYNSPGNPQNGLPQNPGLLFAAFQAACSPGSPASANLARICDGVIHFYLGAFATNGFPIFSDGSTTAYFRSTNFLTMSNSIVHPAQAVPGPYPGNLAGLSLWSNAVPASVELQLGILEQHAWERYNSIGISAARLAYLQREDISSRVHLFRQRIAVRNVDPSAYQ
jgi:prepilin-type N-terminal cleavage/methylation domain-containing protein